jgi:hypothetical protein
MTARLRWAAVLVAFVFVPFVPQIPGCVMASLPKVGRVVDDATGQGLPDVAVIASAIFNAQSPVHGSAHDFPYRLVVRTDSNGYFRIPSTWSQMRLSLPGLDARETWVVTAFKPNYAIAHDLDTISQFDSFGRTIFRPWSTTHSPSADWRGLYVAVEPLRMQQVDLKLNEAAAYYRDVIGLGRYVEGSSSGVEVALRSEAFNALSSEVCGANESETVSGDVGVAFRAFAFDSTKFITMLRRLEPSGFADDYSHPVFHLNSVCQAMRASDKK